MTPDYLPYQLVTVAAHVTVRRPSHHPIWWDLRRGEGGGLLARSAPDESLGVQGWAELSLATSSMLKAVGVGAGVAGATAATAGIKWIVKVRPALARPAGMTVHSPPTSTERLPRGVAKDGVGAVGRLFVGGGLARYFDEEPRKWRMLGELVNTMGV